MFISLSLPKVVPECLPPAPPPRAVGNTTNARVDSTLSCGCQAVVVVVGHCSYAVAAFAGRVDTEGDVGHLLLLHPHRHTYSYTRDSGGLLPFRADPFVAAFAFVYLLLPSQSPWESVRCLSRLP